MVSPGPQTKGLLAGKNLVEMISKKEIDERLKVLGDDITKAYAGDDADLVLVGVLKGSFVFLADLCRHIDLEFKIDFLQASSYGDAQESSGEVQITQDLSSPIEGKNVVLVEDIVDTGLTMKYLLEVLRARNPKSLKVCSLLEKKARAKHEVPIDFLGFGIPDKFVIGYGLDLSGAYRNLPFIGVVETNS